MSDPVSVLNLATAAWAAAVARACWQGGAALLIVAGVIALLRRLSPEGRCWLWRLAYLKFLIALFWATPIDVPVLRTVASVPAATIAPMPAHGTSNAAPPRLAPVPAAASRQPATRGSDPHLSAPDPVPAAPAVPAAPPLSTRTLLFLAWLGGLLWCVRRIRADQKRARDLRADCSTVEDPRLLAGLRELAARVGLEHAPCLLVSPEVTSPLVLGAGQPAIVLPAGLAAYTDAERDWMLAHELAHLRRRDLRWGWLDAIVFSLFFFHPVVWLARPEAHLAGEMAADHLALTVTAGSARDYGALIVKVAAQPALSARSVAGVAMLDGVRSPRSLKRRLTLLRYAGGSRPGRLRVPVWLLLVHVALLVLVPWRLTTRHRKVLPKSASAETLRSRVDGTVVAPDGKPVADAVVRCLIQDSETGEATVQANTRTDAAGRFQINGIPPLPEKEASLDLVAEAAGRGLGSVSSISHAGPVELRLTEPTELQARFLGPDGQPVPGLRVRATAVTDGNSAHFFMPPEDSDWLQWKTDQGGLVRMTGLPRGGRVSVDVRDERFAHLSTDDAWIKLGEASVSSAEV